MQYTLSICLNVTTDKHFNEVVHSNSLLSHVLVNGGGGGGGIPKYSIRDESNQRMKSE